MVCLHVASSVARHVNRSTMSPFPSRASSVRTLPRNTSSSGHLEHDVSSPIQGAASRDYKQNTSSACLSAGRQCPIPQLARATQFSAESSFAEHSAFPPLSTSSFPVKVSGSHGLCQASGTESTGVQGFSSVTHNRASMRSYRSFFWF